MEKAKFVLATTIVATVKKQQVTNRTNPNK